jgi:hypothetical protein
MAVRTGEGQIVSCTGRAVSVGPAPGAIAAPAASEAMILIVGHGRSPSAQAAIEAVGGRGVRAVVAAGFADFLLYNMIKAGILPVCLAPESVARLQEAVESDPGILLTVDFDRQEVRARGDLTAPFEMGDDSESMARRLLMTRRLLDNADLADDCRARMRRGLAAICDTLKVPGADLARSAGRLNRLLAGLALAARAGQEAGRRNDSGRATPPPSR